MKVLKCEKKEKNTVYLEIEVDSAVFEQAVAKAYIKNAAKFSIPGFRKGHAPRKLIEKMYGAGVFYDDAVNIICPDAYNEAVSEQGIEVVDRPTVDIVKIGAGENFVFSATVTVKPEVKLGKYKGVSAKKGIVKVSKAEIDVELDKLRTDNARIITFEEGAPENGDTVTLDYEGSVDGVAFDGGKGENFELKLGSGTFIPGFEEQLVGKTVGEETDVKVTFPEEYHSKELAGKEAVFKCVIHKFTRSELPEMDDEFAKDVSEFDTMEALRADIEKKQKENKKKQVEAEFENAVIDAALETMEADIPECMIEQQTDSSIQNFAYRIQSQGMPFEQYLQYTGMTIEKLREQFREQSEKNVKAGLLLEEVAKAENISVTDEDIAAEQALMAEQYSIDAEKVKELFEANAESLKADIRTKKTVKFLVDNAKSARSAKKEEKEKEEN
ncbi:MAG: trigger factor [Clostridia bacterium]|nr:trigger factor [Clostridia bacterium]